MAQGFAGTYLPFIVSQSLRTAQHSGNDTRRAASSIVICGTTSSSLPAIHGVAPWPWPQPRGGSRQSLAHGCKRSRAG